MSTGDIIKMVLAIIRNAIEQFKLRQRYQEWRSGYAERKADRVRSVAPDDDGRVRKTGDKDKPSN